MRRLLWRGVKALGGKWTWQAPLLQYAASVNKAGQRGGFLDRESVVWACADTASAGGKVQGELSARALGCVCSCAREALGRDKVRTREERVLGGAVSEETQTRTVETRRRLLLRCQTWTRVLRRVTPLRNRKPSSLHACTSTLSTCHSDKNKVGQSCSHVDEP